jgi:hypothetical protein
MQQNQGTEIMMYVIKRNSFYYLQRATFFLLVIFIIISSKFRINEFNIDFTPWITLFLIICLLLTSYLFTKYDIIGKLNFSNLRLILSKNNSLQEILITEKTEVVFFYNSFSGEYSELRIFLYGDKRSDGANNFLVIKNDKEKIKYRILINSEEEARLFISFFTKVRREQSLNVKIRNRMYWI